MNGKQLALIGGAVVAGGVLLYFFGGKLFKGLGGIFSGNNSLTKGTAYEGAGVAGSLGAATNSALGGAPAAIGESLGGVLYSAFGAKADTSGVTYIVRFPDGAKHAVPDTNVDGSGYFSFAGQRFRLGQLNGQRVATAVYTGTGV